MDPKSIIAAMENEVSLRGCFIVNVSVSHDNDIELTIESENGIVELEDCISLSNYFHSIYNQDEEDYSLTVTSAGLDQPFKVMKQYIKAVGTTVEVSLKGGKKITGLLKAVDENGISLFYTAKEAVEGKKRKELVEHCDTFVFENINAVYPHIVFD